MMKTIESFVHFASGRLVMINLALLAFIKLILPFSGSGLAEISQLVQPFNVDAIVEHTNDFRRQAALPLLARSVVLDRAAQAKLADMEAMGYFAHVSPGGKTGWYFVSTQGYAYQAAGENLAKGFTQPKDIVVAWMQSAAHRANIMSPAYRDIGVASGRVTINGSTTTVVVQLFGTPATIPREPVAIKPSAISTDQRVPQVLAPTVVLSVQGAAIDHASRSLASTATLYLSVLLGALILCALVVRAQRSLAWALAANAFVLLLFTVIPAVPMIEHLIF